MYNKNQHLKMNNQLSITELLNYATVRIECSLKNNKISTGTGFFFKFKEKSNGAFCPVIITNKHVIKNAVKARFYLTPTDNKGNPIDNKPKSISFNAPFETYESRWHFHPDPKVDLCAMGITDVSYLFKKKFGSYFYTLFFNKKMLPKASDKKSISAIEDVYMIGYPNGLWDNVNNKPIIRKGITATNFNFDYQGEKEFLIDMACFPGSSGSPIILINNKAEITTRKLMLLGVLYAGPQHIIESTLELTHNRKIKTTSNIVSLRPTTSCMLHLIS